MHEAELAKVMDTTHEMDELIAGLVTSALSTMPTSGVDHLRAEAARIATEQDSDTSTIMAELVIGTGQAPSPDKVEHNAVLQSLPTWIDAVTLYTRIQKQATLTAAIVEHLAYENNMNEQHCNQ